VTTKRFSATTIAALTFCVLTVIAISCSMKNYVEERNEIDATMCMHDVVVKSNLTRTGNRIKDMDNTLAQVAKECSVEIDYD